MRIPTRTRRDHPASFTLIELIVVMAIIAVLVSLTTAAVMKILAKGPIVTARTEIGQLELALGTAMTQLGSGQANFIPSSITIREDGKYVSTNAQHVITVRVLTLLFGKSCANFGPNYVQIDWNGDGTITAGDMVLQGQECLVFFLGGIPSATGATNACLGFSNNPANPAAAGGTRLGPFYTAFDASRLIRRTTVRAAAPAGFLVYLDPFLSQSGGARQPYAYFSNYGAGNDYVTTDCAALGPNLIPYYTKSGTTINYINPKGFQIISAGPDGKWGIFTGTNWTPLNGYAGIAPGADDMANFSKNPLGTGN